MLLNAQELNTCLLNGTPLVEGGGVAQCVALAEEAEGVLVEVGSGESGGVALCGGAELAGVFTLGLGLALGVGQALSGGAVVRVRSGEAAGVASALAHGYPRPYGLGPAVTVMDPFLVKESGPVALVDRPYIFTDDAPVAVVVAAF